MLGVFSATGGILVLFRVHPFTHKWAFLRAYGDFFFFFQILPFCPSSRAATISLTWGFSLLSKNLSIECTSVNEVGPGTQGRIRSIPDLLVTILSPSWTWERLCTPLWSERGLYMYLSAFCRLGPPAVCTIRACSICTPSSFLNLKTHLLHLVYSVSFPH